MKLEGFLADLGLALAMSIALSIVVKAIQLWLGLPDSGGWVRLMDGLVVYTVGYVIGSRVAKRKFRETVPHWELRK